MGILFNGGVLASPPMPACSDVTLVACPARGGNINTTEMREPCNAGLFYLLAC